MSDAYIPGLTRGLVVDDEEIILSFLKRLLSGWGYETELSIIPRSHYKNPKE
jgi:DNA-binding NtrC family response regulator